MDRIEKRTIWSAWVRSRQERIFAFIQGLCDRSSIGYDRRNSPSNVVCQVTGIKSRGKQSELM